MTDYVLVHGAWHGSWCWARVRRLLAAGAHRVFTPTLTGVGELSHLLSRDVGLDTHIADVANLMIWENLRDVVLVGHSYGVSSYATSPTGCRTGFACSSISTPSFPR